MSWLDLYLECSRDRAAGLTATDDMVDRNAKFRNYVYREADVLGFPRCRFRVAETVCEGMDSWAKFTATSDVHALADAMRELDAISAAKFLSAKASA